nr:translation initiation factor eIF-2B subunit alpha-like isoform X2 [Physcomitrium patens]PNR38039.1 hypothetical protein PHYPA_021150 [Physcomitrium patens]|eukprot:XP_024399407.1 translation initiation factor eIF-2B subunit alpha-like isoform X2 [Physcomitrella patens]
MELCNPYHEDRNVSQDERDFNPSSVTFEWLRQAESASLYGGSEDYTRPVLHHVRSWGREVVREKPFSVIHEFDAWRKNPELAEAVAAIKALTAVIKRSGASTMMGLEVELKEASDALKAWDESSISLSAGCDLFMRYVTRTSAIEYEDIEAGKARLIERGEKFGDISQKARRTIAELGKDFIVNGTTVLTHGYSRVVIALLKLAASEGKDFNVVCTEGRPDNTGAEMAKELVPAGIPVTLVLDAGVAYMMETIDMVLVGADGVVESGGIINMLGTYQTALIARSLKKPVYVAAESYKFARLFPLDQRDMSPAPRHVDFLVPLPQTVRVENSARDYTPPQYLTLLFTDLGILTPSAVSDELIQLYL